MKQLRQYSLQSGFSLIELAIVLFIVTLLLGGLLVPLSAQIDQQRAKETQKTLADLKDALIGFAIVNGRLPCPATATSNGVENFCTLTTGIAGCPTTTVIQPHGNCSNYNDGFVPAASLGMTPVDANGYLLDGWNNRIRYAVSNPTLGTYTHALTAASGIKNATISTLSGANLLYACASATGITGANCGTATKLTDSAAALVFSLGKNGSTTGSGTDEAANLNNDVIFVSHSQTATGSTNGEFDDMLTWLPSAILIGRMVTAGQLP